MKNKTTEWHMNETIEYKTITGNKLRIIRGEKRKKLLQRSYEVVKPVWKIRYKI